MRILAVGDSFMPSAYFEEAFAALGSEHQIAYRQVDPTRTFSPVSASEQKLREYQGAPGELASWMEGVEVLVVQGAPVTDTVLDASRELKLVCCARGGPLNIDVDAATARGLPLVTTPGKNAAAVADLTLAFLVMLARRLGAAQQFLIDGNVVGDNWEGARFLGNDLRRHVLGLIGFGSVGRQVAARARAFGLSVLVHDPYVALTEEGIEQVATLAELLERSDFVSLHARANTDNKNLIDAGAFAAMKPGAMLINTARETLIDEDALDAALASGRLGGAALDVVHTIDGANPHRLLRHDNVVLTPHIGGATRETLLQGAEMIADEILRFAAGEKLLNVANAIEPAAP